MPKGEKIDAIDLKILSCLQDNGRITNQRLADIVGLSASACLARVGKLEKSGLISGYGARLDLSKLRETVTVIAEITLEKQGVKQQTTFEKILKSIDQVIDCYEVSGQHDYVARFVCASIGEYQDITADLLADPRLALKQITSLIAMRPVREFKGYPLETLGANRRK
jgi:DNA-binding Lrp family transcriptional regulator